MTCTTSKASGEKAIPYPGLPSILIPPCQLEMDTMATTLEGTSEDDRAAPLAQSPDEYLEQSLPTYQGCHKRETEICVF